ncbi:hypothetical protein [Streptacidiphilus sp. MAP5-3]|uniref:hypothetical protein n=1 Tax=unclassified Streptacidiphilus TaxID=2643834 RepID=UPI0035163AB9
MHAHNHAPVCGHCDGFPIVAITTGQQTDSGERVTIRVQCPACQGTGTRATNRPVLALAGR